MPAAIAVVGAIMLTALMLRSDLDVNVLHDRNPLYVQLSDGGIRNGYTIKMLNKAYAPRDFRLAAKGLPGARAGRGRARERADPVDHGSGRRASVDPSLCRRSTSKRTRRFPPRAPRSPSWSLPTTARTQAEHETTFQGPER